MPNIAVLLDRTPRPYAYTGDRGEVSDDEEDVVFVSARTTPSSAHRAPLSEQHRRSQRAANAEADEAHLVSKGKQGGNVSKTPGKLQRAKGKWERFPSAKCDSKITAPIPDFNFTSVAAYSSIQPNRSHHGTSSKTNPSLSVQNRLTTSSYSAV